MRTFIFSSCLLLVSGGVGRRAISTTNQLVPESNFPRIDDSSQHITVATTASLPWMTGTAVNPLLRAAHLTANRDEGMVTLLLPWVDLDDQRVLFPNNITFADQATQRAYVLKWLGESGGMPVAARKLKIEFYPGRYLPSYGSIFSMGPYVEDLPDDGTDICILEEVMTPTIARGI